jgi:hypothetical protein
VKQELQSPQTIVGSPRVETVFAEDGDEPEDPAADLPYARWMSRAPDELKRQLADEGHLQQLLRRGGELES